MTSEAETLRTEAGRVMMREHTSASPHIVGHVRAIEDESWNAACSAATEAISRVASMSPAARGDALLALLSVRRIVGSESASLRKPVTP